MDYFPIGSNIFDEGAGTIPVPNTQNTFQTGASDVRLMTHGSTAVQAMSGASTALGIAGAVAKVGGAVVGGMMADTTKDSGTLSANPGFLSLLRPVVTVKQRKYYGAKDSLKDTKGLQSYKSKAISSFSGYIKCEEVKLSDFSATDEEKATIINLLKGGIYV